MLTQKSWKYGATQINTTKRDYPYKKITIKYIKCTSTRMCKQHERQWAQPKLYNGFVVWSFVHSFGSGESLCNLINQPSKNCLSFNQLIPWTMCVVQQVAGFSMLQFYLNVIVYIFQLIRDLPQTSPSCFLIYLSYSSYFFVHFFFFTYRFMFSVKALIGNVKYEH